MHICSIFLVKSQRAVLYYIQAFLPISVWTKQSIVFVLFFIIAIAKCKNVVRQFGAENKNGVKQVFGLADHFRCIFPHPGKPVGHVNRNHSSVLEAFLKLKKKDLIAKKGLKN